MCVQNYKISFIGERKWAKVSSIKEIFGIYSGRHVTASQSPDTKKKLIFFLYRGKSTNFASNYI